MFANGPLFCLFVCVYIYICVCVCVCMCFRILWSSSTEMCQVNELLVLIIADTNRETLPVNHHMTVNLRRSKREATRR